MRRIPSRSGTPKSILTPDRVDTRLGTLDFFDGYPSASTLEKVYDHLDFQRSVRTFLDGIPIASLYAMREGLREVGCADGTVGIFENLTEEEVHNNYTIPRYMAYADIMGVKLDVSPLGENGEITVALVN